MNDNHTRHLVSTLRHIDNLLSEAEHVLATAGGASPFVECAQDSTPVQRKLIHDYVQRIREVMRRGMQDLGLPAPEPVCGALWAASSRVLFARLAVAEMEPRRMGGYGPLSDEDARRINALIAELDAALERLAGFLGRGPAEDLQARLTQLDATVKGAGLLRELERIITAHGLVEFRGALALLLDRLQNGAFEIGVFGRVSSGKSSLLNHLLGADVLPVGVTPVTAIPTRLSRGPAPRVVVQFADRKPLVVGLDRLAEFSTEQANPANQQHVTRIQVELVSPRLPEGVTFVDTPGLGSLATGGAEETLAYLPRCDLGLVLVDAASTLTREDLGMVDALCRAGARPMVLVSKADLLQLADREQIAAYIRRQIQAELNLDIPVHLVSVAGADAALCDQWFENHLRPLLEAHREEAAAAFHRKLEGLRQSVAATLRHRLDRAANTGHPPSSDRMTAALTRLRRADGLIAELQSQTDRLVNDLPALKDGLIQTAVEEWAASWLPPNPGPNTAQGWSCPQSLRRALGAHTARLAQGFESLRQQLEDALAEARHQVAPRNPAAESLPKPRGLPLFDAESLPPVPLRRPPAPVRWLGPRAVRRWAVSRLHRTLDPALTEALNDYRRRLRQWSSQMLAEMRAAFDAQAGPLRAQLESRATAPGPEASRSFIEADLKLLDQPPS